MQIAALDIRACRLPEGLAGPGSLRGGATGALKTAHLAEAFHMPCEIHTAIFHALVMVNLHISGAIRNSAWFEVLWPMAPFSFALPGGLPIVDGMAILSDAPGLGAELDRDMIENATMEVF